MAYTTIDDPSAYFHTQLYAGAGANQDVVNDAYSGDFKPDFLWIKNRTNASYGPHYYDSSRGVKRYFYSDQNYGTYAETYNAAGESSVQLFNTNGFRGGSSANVYSVNWINGIGSNYVAWQWKANGGTTTAFGESGSNPGGTRQTNTAAGFSIIAYTGTGSNGTIAHGLPSTPEFLIFKRRNATQFWCVWHQAIGDDYKLALHLTDGLDADGAFMASTLPTSTNITVGGASVNTNADNGTYICYAFSPVQGYSKFGKYTGNGSTDGPFVYTGFKPAFLMMKEYSSAGGNWVMFDNKRDPSNVTKTRLFPNLTNADNTTRNYVDLLSNGFKLRDTDADHNQSGQSMVYMAFAENPFVTSTGIPTTAR